MIFGLLPAHIYIYIYIYINTINTYEHIPDTHYM